MYDNTCTYLVTVFQGTQHTLPKLIYSHNTDAQEVNIISQEHREVLRHKRVMSGTRLQFGGQISTLLTNQ